MVWGNAESAHPTPSWRAHWVGQSRSPSPRLGRTGSTYGSESNVWGKKKMPRESGLAFAPALRHTSQGGKSIKAGSTPFFPLSFFSFYGNMCLRRETVSLWGFPLQPRGDSKKKSRWLRRKISTWCATKWILGFSRSQRIFTNITAEGCALKKWFKYMRPVQLNRWKSGAEAKSEGYWGGGGGCPGDWGRSLWGTLSISSHLDGGGESSCQQPWGQTAASEAEGEENGQENSGALLLWGR